MPILSNFPGGGGIKLVSATSSNGVAFTGTANGVTALSAGLAVIFVPDRNSSSTTPTFNLNSLGAKEIRRKLSNGAAILTTGGGTTWLYKGCPCVLVYDGTYWITVDFTKPAAADLYGTLSIASGGTGATTQAEALRNLKALPTAGGTMTGTLTTKGIKLTSGTDYGTTLPSSPATNQLFFQTAGTNFVLDNVYPIGSIYMNVNSTNPGTLFGGTWEQIQGKFLLGMSSSYPAGSQGGEASHTLTTAEMPSHGHNPANESGYYGFITNSKKAFEVGDMGSQSGSGRYYPYASAAFDISRNSLTGTTGGGNSHNNMPPYLSIYIWKRTA